MFILGFIIGGLFGIALMCFIKIGDDKDDRL